MQGNGSSEGESTSNSSRPVLIGTVIGGALSGIVGRFLFHPIDTCKAKIQCVTRTRSGRWLPDGVWDTMVRTIRSDGLRKGLYAGFGIGALGAIPGCCLYFTAYEASKRFLFKRTEDDVSPTIEFTCGFLAEAISCFVWVPVDVCKERLQTQRTLQVTDYKGSWDAVRRIMMNEGPRQFYKGYFATLLAFGPMSALYFLLYSQVKGRIVRRRSDSTLLKSTSRDASESKRRPLEKPYNGGSETLTLSVRENLVCASLSACGAAWITTPLDLVKMRLQVQRSAKHSSTGAPTPFSYRNFWHGLLHVLRVEGLTGAFKGGGARCMYHTPTFTVSMVVMSYVRDSYVNWHEGLFEGL